MSERIGNRCTFPKIVGDDVFIIAEYDKEAYGSLRFITSPFHVSNTGIITKIKPDPTRTDSIFIASDNPINSKCRIHSLIGNRNSSVLKTDISRQTRYPVASSFARYLKGAC